MWPMARFICHREHRKLKPLQQHWSILPFSLLRRLHQLARSPYFHKIRCTICMSAIHVVVVAVRTQIRLDIIYYFIHFIIYVGKLWYAFRLFHYRRRIRDARAVVRVLSMCGRSFSPSTEIAYIRFVFQNFSFAHPPSPVPPSSVEWAHSGIYI